jgi:hypothetical protein
MLNSGLAYTCSACPVYNGAATNFTKLFIYDRKETYVERR